MPCQDKTQRFNLWTWQGMIGSGVHKQENELKRWETGSTEQNFQKTMKFIIFFVFFAGILGFGPNLMKIPKLYTDRSGFWSGIQLRNRFRLSINTQYESSEIGYVTKTSNANYSINFQRIYNPQLVIRSTKHTLQYP